MVARIQTQRFDASALLRLVEALEPAPVTPAPELSAIDGGQTLPVDAPRPPANEQLPIASNGGVSSDVLRARLEAAAASQARPQAATAAQHPTLRRGASGAYVKELQKALKAKGFNPGPIDGQFGPKTEAAVKAFQRANHLAVDGIVGPKTWGKLHAAGAASGSSGTSSSGSRPPVPHGRAAIERVFGQHGSSHQVTTTLPIGPGGRNVRVTLHEKLVPVMKAMLQEAKEKDLLKYIHTFDGMYNNRLKRSGSSWSTHAWGIAFDINASEGSSGRVNPKLVALFEKYGFYWGGHFGDAMHFQYCRDY